MTPASRARIVILGSTGSVGRQALEVIAAHPDRLEVIGLVAGSDSGAFDDQVAASGAPHAGIGTEDAVRLAAHPDADVVLNAIVGAAGLRASLGALEAGKRLALANKESLVAGGELCLAAAHRGGGAIVPVDSEHAALTHCLQGIDRSEVSRLVLTASGGPFRERADLGGVTPADALAHPTWSMGPKITVDSATLMNKGLEVIEAHFLFRLPYERIGVVVHPQSAVHGIVELADGSAIMEAAPPDMRIPIAWALLGDRAEGPADGGTRGLDLAALGSLTFQPLDDRRFPAVGLAYRAGAEGGTAPAVLNAANEVAVRAFLDEAISFTDIVPLVADVLDEHGAVAAESLDAVLTADAWARARAHRAVDGSRTEVGAS